MYFKRQNQSACIFLESVICMSSVLKGSRGLLDRNSGHWILLDWKEEDAVEMGHMRFLDVL